MNILADKILVFPTTKRDAKGKLLSEKAMTRFVTSTVDFNTGFIVNPEDKFTEVRDYLLSEWGQDLFEFFIEGYHFSITDITSVVGSNENVWAYILIDDTNEDYPEIKGQDEAGYYKGLNIVFNESDIPQPAEKERVCQLQLLQDGKVPIKAFAHTKSIGILNVDGGDLD